MFPQVSGLVSPKTRTCPEEQRPDYSDDVICDMIAETCIERYAPISGACDDCIVCEDGPRDFMCVPCGHLILCQHCADAHPQTQCPMCCGDVDTIVRVRNPIMRRPIPKEWLLPAHRVLRSCD